MSEYLKQVQRLIVEKTGMELEEITAESCFEDDLNMGEMDVVELLTELEEIYKAEGVLEEKDNIEMVQDLVDVLIEKVE